MIYPLQIPGFENRNIQAQTNAMSGRTTLLIDGQPAASGAKRGQFLLRTADGREVVAFFESAFPDTVPVLVVDGRNIHLAPKLRWYELVWACFPMVLLLIGGIIGGAMGFAGSAINLQIFRSKMPALARYALAALVTLVSFAV